MTINNNWLKSAVKCRRLMRTKGLAIFLLGCLSIAQPVQAASFDCSKSQSKVEHLICDDPELSKLDDELGKIYQEAMNKANDEEKQRLITEQKHWLKFTRNVCTTVSCFKIAYWSRQAELETFFAPHGPLYKKEADKADAIKQILATAPLYESGLNNQQLCRQIFNDLKLMKNIQFVDPVMQTESYEDPALDPWKKNKRGLPLNMDVLCAPYGGGAGDPYAGTIPDDPDGTLGECTVAFGLPPFKLFELAPLQPSENRRYIFYYDGGYGGMNLEWAKPGMGRQGDFKQLDTTNIDGSFAHAMGGWPSYNSIIAYQHQYYFLLLSTEINAYWLSIESVTPNRSKNKIACHWSPAKPEVIKSRKLLAPHQGSK